MAWTIPILAVLLLSLGALSVGASRRREETGALSNRLLNLRSTEPVPRVDFDCLPELPAPVQTYFRKTLVDGQPMIDVARFRQTGELRVSPETERWSAFSASSWVSEMPAAFLWDARIRIAPAVHICVRDSFIEGVGTGHVSLLSALTIGGETDVPELNSGALYRYLAEAVWHPTALLPQCGVQWEAVDDNRAVAYLTESGVSVSLEFRFNSQGEITGIFTEDRFGKFGNRYLRHPWEGHFGNHRRFNGMQIPTEAQVGWHLPQGWWLFWKGEIVAAEFEFRQ